MVNAVPRLVAVVFRFVGTFNRHADIVSLLRLQLGELYADFLQMQARDLLIQMFRQDVDLIVIFIPFGPKFDLRQDLIGK